MDIDDTILQAHPDYVSVWRHGPDGGCSFDHKSNPAYSYDYREFNDHDKVAASITNGTPLWRNLRILDNCYKKGRDVVYLTARSMNRDELYDILYDFLRYKDDDGELHELGDRLRREFCSAIDDKTVIYPGATDGEKKANVLRKLCARYPLVKFVDDDHLNIKACRALNIPNLQVIEAQPN